MENRYYDSLFENFYFFDIFIFSNEYIMSRN